MGCNCKKKSKGTVVNRNAIPKSRYNSKKSQRTAVKRAVQRRVAVHSRLRPKSGEKE